MRTHSMIMADNYPNTNIPPPGATYEMNFEVSQFFELNDWIEDDTLFSSFNPSGYPNYTSNEVVGMGSSSHEGTINRESGNGKEKKEIKDKVAFKTKSEIEILDDGFKWRKYGKKMVKNSPNPRNYYKCSVERCPVKKRVERDKEDPCYVVTTYEGIHNHQGPTV
ncbi:hypothetical protein ACJIZ3_001670 [Penstemon smallii]|uniref:WRKY domain-containing protein n=1 Tax=Penstemon smallii TaxID=265156 RepID=A0ABD3U7E5_9LAMI